MKIPAVNANGGGYDYTNPTSILDTNSATAADHITTYTATEDGVLIASNMASGLTVINFYLVIGGVAQSPAIYTSSGQAGAAITGMLPITKGTTVKYEGACVGTWIFDRLKFYPCI